MSAAIPASSQSSSPVNVLSNSPVNFGKERSSSRFTGSPDSTTGSSRNQKCRTVGVGEHHVSPNKKNHSYTAEIEGRAVKINFKRLHK